MEWEKVRCPICRSEHCTKRQFEASFLEFVCAKCTAFTMHEEILHNLYRLLKKEDRDKVSAAIKHHFEDLGARIKIVVWHGKNPDSGVKEKTISELIREGGAILRGLAGRPRTA